MSTQVPVSSAIIIEQGNVQLGKFVGFSLGSGFSVSDQGLLLAIDTLRPPVEIAALAIDWSRGDVFFKTLAAGANVFTFANAANGQVIIVEVTGAASTLTWPTVKWAGGVVPTQTASGTDVYTFVKRGSNIFGSVVQAMA